VFDYLNTTETSDGQCEWMAKYKYRIY